MSLSFADDLISQGSSAIHEWFDQNYSAYQPSPYEVNWWLYLAQAATLQAKFHPELTDDERIDWAYLSVKLYDYLAHMEPPENFVSKELSGVMLRINMIDTFGARTNHPLLDPDILEDWFFEKYPMPVSEMRTSIVAKDNTYFSGRWDGGTLSISLAVVEFLVENNYGRKTTELAEWASLRELL